MAQHGVTPSVIIITTHTTRATHANVIFTKRLHHHAHMTGASEASISLAWSSRSEQCYLDC